MQKLPVGKEDNIKMEPRICDKLYLKNIECSIIKNETWWWKKYVIVCHLDWETVWLQKPGSQQYRGKFLYTQTV